MIHQGIVLVIEHTVKMFNDFTRLPSTFEYSQKVIQNGKNNI